MATEHSIMIIDLRLLQEVQAGETVVKPNDAFRPLGAEKLQE